MYRLLVNIVAELIRKCVAENATTSQDQEAYLENYKGLKARYEAATQRLKQVEYQQMERKQRRQKMLEFIRMLEQADGLLTEFDEGLWNATVETVTVQVDGRVVFRWKNGIDTLCVFVKRKMVQSLLVKNGPLGKSNVCIFRPY